MIKALKSSQHLKKKRKPRQYKPKNLPDDGLPTWKDGPHTLVFSRQKPNKPGAKSRQELHQIRIEEGKEQVRKYAKVTSNRLGPGVYRIPIEELIKQVPEDILDKFVGETAGIVSQEQLANIPAGATHLSDEVKEKTRAIFSPNPGPQTEFLAASEREVFFGGSKGGGKSQALLVDPIRFCKYSEHRALILRRTMPDLRDIIYKAGNLYPRAFPGTKYKAQENLFVFPSGARIEFGYADTVQDLTRYHGQNFNYVAVDELPMFPFYDELMLVLRSCIRTTDPKHLPIQFRATGMPGCIASDKVRKEFIDRGDVGKTFFVDVPIHLPNGQVIVERISKKYIKSTVYDNPYLMKDNSYLASLSSLSPTKRAQWLSGDWDVVEGAAFPEFSPMDHVVTPFEIPSTWIRYRGCDWGYNQPGCILWAATSPDDVIVVYREFYFKGRTPLEVAYEGKSKEIGEMITAGIMDVSAWSKHGGAQSTPGSIMARIWPSWVPSSRSQVNNKSSRAAGKVQVHHMLSSNPETGKPRMFIFNTCKNLIRQLSGLMPDPNNPENVDTKMEDHAYDALTYLLQSRLVKLPQWYGGIKSQAMFDKQYVPKDSVFGY